jgi:AcrR family transcriptional regulator
MTKDRSPRRAALSPERIVAAAAALVDREGAEALSARRLAAALGCEAMSLYHHVPNMGGLLDAVVDDALGAVPLPPADAADPGRQLRAMAGAYLKLAATHPHRFRVLGARRWRTPAELAYQSRMIELLVSAGLKPRAALRAARVLLVYVNGAGLAIAGWTLEGDQVPTETAPPAVRNLLRYSKASAVSEDLRGGLDAIIASLLPER